MRTAATERRLREEREEQAVAASVAVSFAQKGLARQSWPIGQSTEKRRAKKEVE
jgi:hypothetical protein